MADVVLSAPSIQQIAKRLQSTEVEYDGKQQSVGDFVAEGRQQARQRRKEDDENAIFMRFGAALLERAVTGASYDRRIEVFERQLSDPDVLTYDLAEEMLCKSRYRWPKNGPATLMDFRDLVLKETFYWSTYFSQAEETWEGGFERDPMLKIKGVGYKTRDFALSEFSDYFCPIDIHIRRLLARTGLLLHGYGDPDISTGQQDPDYRFLRRLVHKLAKQTGFPEHPKALSPADIDRTLWYFGQGRCGAHPNCDECPCNDLCLTGVYRNAQA